MVKFTSIIEQLKEWEGLPASVLPEDTLKEAIAAVRLILDGLHAQIFDREEEPEPEPAATPAPRSGVVDSGRFTVSDVPNSGLQWSVMLAGQRLELRLVMSRALPEGCEARSSGEIGSLRRSNLLRQMQRPALEFLELFARPAFRE